jgi:phosphohistidine phosphatase
MKIYLMQHGQSKSAEEDPERDLTLEGIENTRMIANFFKNIRHDIGRIYHSPKTRARSTAEIFLAALDYEGEVVEYENMKPKDEVEPLISDILNFEGEEVAVIGHLPYLQKFLSMILGLKKDSEVLKFHNSGISCISRTNGSWHLEWVVIPEILI